MVMSMAETLRSFGSGMAALMLLWTMCQNFIPRQLSSYFKRLKWKFYPYVQVNFPEYETDGFQRSRAYMAIQRYLDKISSGQARRLKANVVHDSEAVVFTMEYNEEVTDEFRGTKLWWASKHHIPTNQAISWSSREDEKKSFELTFHKRHRETVKLDYVKHVLEQGNEIAVKERRRKLYTNTKAGESSGYGRPRMWTHITFEHPASFETLAMESKKKQEIIDDLINFTQAKDYYARIGKAWKRGYLLHGPPGTGKSTMIAAMANFLKYDVYDLELTSVKDNTDLRKLLIDTSAKSIIVIEDIDCSLDLTGQREKGKGKAEEKEKDKDQKEKEASVEEMVKKKMEESKKSSEVTLSGLLNFIDGLWSSCGGERIIVFTTNYVDKLDPALIRPGRMDKRIELSYCGFEPFKMLAKIYLNVESHDLFTKVESLMEVTKMTPADVAENLMPKFTGEDASLCLEGLIVALEQAKLAEEVAKAKAEEEARAKAEEERKLKDVAKSAETENVTKSVEIESMAKSGGTKRAVEEVKENGCT